MKITPTKLALNLITELQQAVVEIKALEENATNSVEKRAYNNVLKCIEQHLTNAKSS